MRISVGHHLFRKSESSSEQGSENSKFDVSLRVCHRSKCGNYVAVTDWNKSLAVANPKKPEIYTVDELNNLIREKKLQVDFHSLPTEMTVTDEAFIKQYGKKRLGWLKKRDNKFRKIESLTTKELIEKYLYGGGLFDEMKQLVQDGEGWTSVGAYVNALNRFIVFGTTPNALMPFKLKNCGTTFQLAEKPHKDNVKRGRGGTTNEKSLSKTRAATQQDIDNIRSLIKFLKKKKRQGQKIDTQRAYKDFDKMFQWVQVVLKSEFGEQSLTYVPNAEEFTISYRQFSYHYNKLLGNWGKERLKVGETDFAKDFEDRQGSALDGVQGATFRYEIDATVLDLYVRYPYQTGYRYSMGRPVLYLVIDVKSAMIVGFYLGFDGPNSAGVSQALANAFMCKVEFAKRYHKVIQHSDWPVHHIPVEITIDNGTEYPYSLISSIIKNEIGVEVVNYTAIYRGDFKGTVESGIKRVNNEFVHYEPGAIFKETPRDEQHPSNRAFWDYDALVRLLIDEIIIYNKTANRERHLTKGEVDADIDISPEDIFLHSLKEDMQGGMPTSIEDEGRIKWALLPEESATIREDCVYFEGLEYHSDYFKETGRYAEAKKKREKILVKRARDWANHIFYKTNDGEYITLTLKNINNGSPYLDMHWEAIHHLQKYMSSKRHLLKQSARYLRAATETKKHAEKMRMLNDLNGVKISERKSMQPGVNQRKDIQKAHLAAQHANNIMNAFGHQAEATIDTQKSSFTDMNDELYG